MFWANNEGTHNFGYECAMPTVFTLENVTVNDENLGADKNIYMLPPYDSFKVTEKPYPYITTKKLVIKNLKITSGRKYYVSPCDERYEGLTVIRE